MTLAAWTFSLGRESPLWICGGGGGASGAGVKTEREVTRGKRRAARKRRGAVRVCAAGDRHGPGERASTVRGSGQGQRHHPGAGAPRVVPLTVGRTRCICGTSAVGRISGVRRWRRGGLELVGWCASLEANVGLGVGACLHGLIHTLRWLRACMISRST